MKKRIDYIDMCKGTGILLIILGHILSGGMVRHWIYSFHVMLFFFLSGYTFKYSKENIFKKLFIKKFRTIMLPYFLFSLLCYLYWALIEGRFRSIKEPILKPFIGIFYGSGSDWLTFNAAMWFLPCLFITIILFYWIKSSKVGLYIMLVISSIVGYLIAQFLNVRFFWGIDIAFMSVFFFGIGYLFNRCSINNIKKSYMVIISIVCLLINLLMMHENTDVAVSSLIYGNYFLFMVSAISGIGFTYFICKIINKKCILSYFGKNSLIILCIGEPIRRIVTLVVAKVLRISPEILRQSVMYSLIIMVLICVTLVPCIYIINNYFYLLLGKSKKVE